jgi:hypothetical protein
MNYQTASDNVFASGFIPDGFNGQKRKVHFHYNESDEFIWVVADCGCFLFDAVPAETLERAYTRLYHSPRITHLLRL